MEYFNVFRPQGLKKIAYLTVLIMFWLWEMVEQTTIQYKAE